MVKVSLCVATRNRPAMLRPLLKSLVDLDVPDGTDVEVLVGDNSTDDRSAEVCADFPTVDHLRNVGDLGAYGNFNSLLARAGGEWVQIIADDDEVHPELLHGLAGVLADPDPVIITGVVDFTGPYGPRMHAEYHARLERMGITRPATIPGGQLLNAALIHGSPFVFSTVLVRRRAAIAVGGFPEHFRLQGDFEFWLRLLATGSAHFSAAPVGALRAYEDNELEKEERAAREFRLERTLIRLIALDRHDHLLDPAVRRTMIAEVRRELPRIRTFARVGYSRAQTEGLITELVDRAQQRQGAHGLLTRLEPLGARALAQQPRWLLAAALRVADELRTRAGIPPDGSDVGERHPGALGRIEMSAAVTVADDADPPQQP